MTVRPAAPADSAAILALYDDARAALAAAGIPQWQNGYPNRESLLKDLADGSSMVLCDGGNVVATAAFLRGGEPTYRIITGGKWQCEGRYFTVHRVAVRSDCKRQGAAGRLFAAAEETARAEGFVSLRIDTHRDNLPMRKTLERNGFVCCGEIRLDDGSPRLGYEKPLQ